MPRRSDGRYIVVHGASVKFLIDNANIDLAAWACETQCFANNRNGTDLTQGLGELELKPETLRYVACATSDLLEDASINIENWLTGKVARAMRAAVSAGVMTGDGIGKPLGILNPAAGIPVCETSEHTPTDRFSWQDLLGLRFEVPMQYWDANCANLCNQRTAGLLMTMSDAAGRPIMLQNMVDPLQFTLCGMPLRIVSQMPDCLPGSTCIAFGNWRLAYTIVTRKAMTMIAGPIQRGILSPL